MSERLKILYEGRGFFAVSKPAGLSVHGGAGVEKTLLAELVKKTGRKIFPIHRLDKETSGVILVADNAETAASMSKSLEKADKRYLAVVKGRLAGKKTLIEEPIEVDGKKLESSTEVRSLAVFGSLSLVEARLITGRKHQIRQHLALRDHPVLGDRKYGDFEFNRQIRAKWGVDDLFLHAWRIAFVPWKGDEVRLQASPPKHFEELLARFNAGKPWA